MQAALRDVDRLLAQGAGRGDGAGEAEAEMEAKMRREAGSRMDQIAVSLSNATNILLFFLKVSRLLCDTHRSDAPHKRAAGVHVHPWQY